MSKFVLKKDTSREELDWVYLAWLSNPPMTILDPCVGNIGYGLTDMYPKNNYDVTCAIDFLLFLNY